MYKIKLNNNQIQQIYNITDNADKQSKLMSVLSYLIKYTDNVTNKLTKSLSTLYKMYCRLEYRKISNCYFFKLVDLLEEHKLYVGERRKSNNRVSKIVSEKVSEIDIAETVENTSLEGNFEKHNNLITNNTITYTLYTANAIKVSAIDLVDEVMKDLKIRSKIIKSMVVAKLQNIELDAVGAVNYIVKVITEKTQQYNAIRVKYAKAVAKTKYAKAKNTFKATAPMSARTFNNFEPREYDYDDLEKRLLGW